MSYQVIARKWRPQRFEEVTGQETITQTLRNALEHDRLHHAYLFSGARGVGKTTTARLLAKALNCHKTGDKPNLVPCAFNDPDACPSCVEIAESRSIDVLEIDAASHTGIDDVRQTIIESININPARDRFKVFIIDEVHQLSRPAFNALLKTLEEPPERVVFIMATTELHKVPDTILSRCQEFEFRTIPLEKIYARLKMIAEAEKIEISDDALRELARSGEGSMRDAQSNFDQVISFSGTKIGVDEVVGALGFASSDMLSRVISGIADSDARSILAVVDDLIARGHDLRNFSRDMLAVFRDLLVFKVGGVDIGGNSIFSGEMLEKHAAAFSETDLLRFFNSLADTELKLRDAAQSRFVLEMGLIKLMEMRRLAPIEDILKKLADLESTSGPRAGTASAAAGNTEKKTLKSEPSEVTKARPPVNDAPGSSKPEIAPEEPSYFAEIPPADVPTARMAEPAPQQYVKATPISEFVESIPVRLPPISSEELEHVEDKWLDNAYEELLIRLGDDLKPIPGASAIVDRIAAAFSPRVEEENGVSAASRPSIDLSAIIPVFDDDEDETVPELPPNPTEDQLREYAENHPVVKKALRVFRARIIEVNRIERTEAAHAK